MAQARGLIFVLRFLRLSSGEMPTYEYRCPDGHVVERFLKMSEATAELTCPVCGKVAVRQLSGGAGLVFKGSGFYLTDYGRNAHRGSAPPSGGDSSKGEGSAGGGSGSESKSTDAAKPAGESKSEATKSEPKPAESKSSETKSATTSSSRGTSGPKSDS